MKSLAERGIYFDARLADSAVERMGRYRFQGRDFPLTDWQAEHIIRPLWGWRRADGTRRFRRFLITFARKNGKTTLIGLLSADLLYFDDDAFPEIDLAAADRDQAGICYGVVSSLIQENPQLDRFARVTDSKKRIDILLTDKTGGVRRKGHLKALSSDAKTKHGLNPSVVVMDELHVWPGRKLFEALTTGRGSRKSPLRLVISTMPEDSGGTNVMEEQVTRTQAVLSGLIDDPTTGGYLCIPPDGADPHDEATWALGNPGLGTIKSLDTMREDYQEAKDIPALFNAWCQFELNMRVERQAAALSKEQWDAQQAPFDPLPGARCILGLDLSSTVDMTGAARIYPQANGDWWVKFDAWTPGQTMIPREKKDMIPYTSWARDGYLHKMPGKAIDHGILKQWVLDLLAECDLVQVSCDPWNAGNFLQDLENEGLSVNSIRQGYASMNAPCKELLRRLLEGTIWFHPHPVADWMRANVIFTRDPAGNLKPDRRREREKIDVFAALLNAIDVAMRIAPKPEAPRRSVYNTRAPLVLSV
jgi:phage terminase large subunit-like protein